MIEQCINPILNVQSRSGQNALLGTATGGGGIHGHGHGPAHERHIDIGRILHNDLSPGAVDGYFRDFIAAVAATAASSGVHAGTNGSSHGRPWRSGVIPVHLVDSRSSSGAIPASTIIGVGGGMVQILLVDLLHLLLDVPLLSINVVSPFLGINVDLPGEEIELLGNVLVSRHEGGDGANQ